MAQPTGAIGAAVQAALDRATAEGAGKLPGGPQTPLELGGAGWLNTLKRTGKKLARTG